MRLHLGCGSVVPEGWVNVDYALGARMRCIPVLGRFAGRFFSTPWNPDIVLHDLRKPFPWQSGVAEAIYSSHTLEHLSKADGEHFISECARVLRPGGVLRIVVPNLRGYIDEYVAGRLPSRDFLAELYVFGTRDLGPVKGIVAQLSNSSHRCMYDDTALTDLMKRNGLSSHVCAPQESEISDIGNLEQPERVWPADKLAKNLFVEGRK